MILFFFGVGCNADPFTFGDPAAAGNTPDIETARPQLFSRLDHENTDEKLEIFFGISGQPNLTHRTCASLIPLRRPV